MDVNNKTLATQFLRDRGRGDFLQIVIFISIKLLLECRMKSFMQITSLHISSLKYFHINTCTINVSLVDLQTRPLGYLITYITFFNERRRLSSRGYFWSPSCVIRLRLMFAGMLFGFSPIIIIIRSCMLFSKFQPTKFCFKSHSSKIGLPSYITR